jgi:hypothetical protein
MFRFFDAGDGGGGSPEPVVAAEIPSADKDLFAKVGVTDPAVFGKPGDVAYDGALTVAKKSASAMGKVYDREKEAKELRQKLAKIENAGKQDVLTAEGTLDTEKLRTIMEDARNYSELSGLFDALESRGLLSDKAGKILRSGNVQAALLALEMLGDAAVAEPAAVGLTEEKIAGMIQDSNKKLLQQFGVNTDVAPAGGPPKPADGKSLPAEAQAIADRYFNDEPRPQTKKFLDALAPKPAAPAAK